MLNAEGGLAGPVTAEAEYGLRNSGFTQRDSLFRKSDAKPLRSFIHKPASTRDCSVAVGVCFDDGHDACSRTYTGLDLVEVCGKVVEIDLNPRRTLRHGLV